MEYWWTRKGWVVVGISSGGANGHGKVESGMLGGEARHGPWQLSHDSQKLSIAR